MANSNSNSNSNSKNAQTDPLMVQFMQMQEVAHSALLARLLSRNTTKTRKNETICTYAYGDEDRLTALKEAGIPPISVADGLVYRFGVSGTMSRMLDSNNPFKIISEGSRRNVEKLLFADTVARMVESNDLSIDTLYRLCTVASAAIDSVSDDPDSEVDPEIYFPNNVLETVSKLLGKSILAYNTGELRAVRSDKLAAKAKKRVQDNKTKTTVILPPVWLKLEDWPLS